MSAEISSSSKPSPRQAALECLTASAAANIPGVDSASITMYGEDHTLYTVGATDVVAEQSDALQYELHEGPCHEAITDERHVLVNDLSAAPAYPRYAPRAMELGIRAQAAWQLTSNGNRAGVNLYSRTPGAFDHSTVQVAEMFATQAAALLEYAEQVEQLNVAVHTRTDIGTAVGIIMERYRIGRPQAFSFLVRSSNNRNIKLRTIAQQIIDCTFDSTAEEDRRSREWP